MEAQVVRKLDELGRILLPAEMRNELGWGMSSKIAMTKVEKGIVLETYQESCFLCGKEENLHKINEKAICQSCIEK